jgi:hypothetical protein
MKTTTSNTSSRRERKALRRTGMRAPRKRLWLPRGRRRLRAAKRRRESSSSSKRTIERPKWKKII